MSTLQVNLSLDPRDIKINPEYEAMVPPLSTEEYTRLKNSISEVGLYEPIIISTENVVLDGHHRFKACLEIKVTPRFSIKKFNSKNDEEIYVIETNVIRRQLNQYQMTIMGQKLEPKYVLSAKDRQGTRTDLTSDKNLSNVNYGKAAEQAAKTVGFKNPETYRQAKKVLESADEKTLKDFKKGTLKVYTAYKNIEVAKKKDELIAKIPTLQAINDVFDCIVIDPPWPVEAFDQAGFRGGTTYPTLSIDDLKQMKIPAKNDCVLWLWTINHFMHDAYHILDSWGFEPKTILTWGKTSHYVGPWLRGKTEHCILAIRGHPLWDLKGQSTLLIAPNQGHSIKPDEFYSLVETLCPGYKLDYFARKTRVGWVTYGTMEDSDCVG